MTSEEEAPMPSAPSSPLNCSNREALAALLGLTTPELDALSWIGGEGAPVLLNPNRDDEQHAVIVRSPREPEGPFLVYTVSEWEAFLQGARDNEFDNL